MWDGSGGGGRWVFELCETIERPPVDILPQRSGKVRREGSEESPCLNTKNSRRQWVGQGWGNRQTIDTPWHGHVQFSSIQERDSEKYWARVLVQTYRIWQDAGLRKVPRLRRDVRPVNGCSIGEDAVGIRSRLGVRIVCQASFSASARNGTSLGMNNVGQRDKT